MTLEDLEREEKLFQRQVCSHKKSVRRLSKALFQVLSIYALVQGVIFAAVAQTTVFTCAEWWGPVLIAVAITLGTLFGVVDKLLSIGRHKEEARKFKARQNAVFDVIDTLRWEGSQFDLENADPQNSSRQAQAPGLREVVSMYGLLVLSFLIGFSFLVIISCLKMLCSSSAGCKCQQN